MKVVHTELDGVLLFQPTPFRDERGFFSRTFDAAVAADVGVDNASFLQDSQSRTRRDVVRGLHGRGGAGEAKLMRCARGAAHLVVLDARPASASFGEHITLQLDDEDMINAFIPAGMFVGFQVLSEHADICYRIDRLHVESESLAVRHDDPDLGIAWPRPVTGISKRDQEASSWAEMRRLLQTAQP